MCKPWKMNGAKGDEKFSIQERKANCELEEERRFVGFHFPSQYDEYEWERGLLGYQVQGYPSG